MTIITSIENHKKTSDKCLKPATVERISDLFRSVGKLGNCIALITIPANRVNTVDSFRVRKEFDTHGRIDFYKHLTGVRPSQMKSFFELDDYDLACMQIYGMEGLEGQKQEMLGHSCSVDHIIPITWGGTNDLHNLCLLPKKINRLKSDFEGAQLRLNPARKTITTLTPPRMPDGSYDIFPRFPYDYY